MGWEQIQQKLNKIENEYINLSITIEYISNESNFETENQNINTSLFYLVKSIIKTIENIPKDINEIRSKMMEYGNDITKIIGFLEKIEKDFDNLNKGVLLSKTLVEISDKTYEYETGYENSLKFKCHKNMQEKVIDICENDNMSIKEKYEYADDFDKTLSTPLKGELHVQSLIGPDDKKIVNSFLTKLFLEKMKCSNPLQKMEKYHQTILEIGAYAEDKLANGSLLERLNDLGTILESPFVKSLNKGKKY